MRKPGLLLLLFFLTACGWTSGGGEAPSLSPSPTAFVQETATLPARPEPTSPPTSAPPTVAPPAASPIPTTAAPTEAAAVPPDAVDAAEFPDSAGYAWTPLINDLRTPIGMAHAEDGSGRLFILEQNGAIRIYKNGALLQTPFLDIISKVNSGGNEQGLLGLAFHPRYSENGYFYVNYTRVPDGATVIARFQAATDDPDHADPGTEMQLLTIAQPFPNHNGGAVVFGPDGYLYLALGDGGAAGDPYLHGQAKQTLLGKILRVDVDSGVPYAIPADNPFAGGGGAPEVWAYGLRNPWRIAFDRQTGELYIADVGQNQWEEINYLPAGAAGGANFGWNYFEASHPYQGNLPPDVTVIAPVVEYSHTEGGCSVTGGSVYRGRTLPAWQGIYIYGDYCTGNVWGLLRTAAGSWQSRLIFTNAGRIASFGEDEAGEIYLIDRMGLISRLEARP